MQFVPELLGIVVIDEFLQTLEVLKIAFRVQFQALRKHTYKTVIWTNLIVLKMFQKESSSRKGIQLKMCLFYLSL